MSESSHHSADGRAELGALLVLLHDADAAFRSVEATWHVWRHTERLRQASHAHTEEQKRRGASISTFGIAGGAPEPPEDEETVRIWRAGDRFREEHHGGRRDGYYAVAAGRVWWMWGERIGARSNQDDPSVGSGVGHELDIMLDPTPLQRSRPGSGPLRPPAASSKQPLGTCLLSADWKNGAGGYEVRGDGVGG